MRPAHVKVMETKYGYDKLHKIMAICIAAVLELNVSNVNVIEYTLHI